MTSETEIAMAVATVERLSAAMRKAGALKVVIGGVEIVLDPAGPQRKVSARKPHGSGTPSPTVDDDEILFAATEGYTDQ